MEEEKKDERKGDLLVTKGYGRNHPMRKVDDPFDMAYLEADLESISFMVSISIDGDPRGGSSGTNADIEIPAEKIDIDAIKEIFGDDLEKEFNLMGNESALRTLKVKKIVDAGEIDFQSHPIDSLDTLVENVTANKYPHGKPYGEKKEYTSRADLSVCVVEYRASDMKDKYVDEADREGWRWTRYSGRVIGGGTYEKGPFLEKKILIREMSCKKEEEFQESAKAQVDMTMKVLELGGLDEFADKEKTKKHLYEKVLEKKMEGYKLPDESKSGC